MELLYFLESIRNPVLDVIIQAITNLGSEIVFLVLGMLMFWCVDKRQGYFILLTGFAGTYINQFLKITCRIPRPWVRDPSFTIVESARAGATGYSFPSGHTQIAVGTFGGLALCRKETWLRVVCLVLAVLVPFSRMYLGVHTPADVGAAALCALCLILILWPLFQKHGTAPRLMLPVCGAITVLGLSFLLFCTLYPFPADTDPVNLAEAVKNAYSLLGALLGLWVIWLLDERLIHFDTKAPLLGQAVKLLAGFVLLLFIMEGTKPLFHLIFSGHPVAHTFRYFLTVLFAGGVWPLTFRWFARFPGKRKH